nr:hypothetical protein [Streptococcus oralis]
LTLESPDAIRLVAFVSFFIGLTRNTEATRINKLPAINEHVAKTNAHFVTKEAEGGASASKNIAFVPISVFNGSPKRTVAIPLGVS